VDDDGAWTLAVSLGIGLLLGVERERHKGRGPGRGAAGIRTFALVSLAGGLCMEVDGAALVAVGAAFVALAALFGYARSGADDPGLTTEVALVVAFLLGALARTNAELAAGAAVAVAILLAARTRLHRLVRDVLTEQELHDGLLLAAAALIVLPLLPDEPVGPYDVLVPFTLWRLVVLMLAVSAGGYIATRLLGPRFGLPLAGLASGFVSSTMTIAAMGSRARRDEALRTPAIAGAVLSTVATVVITVVICGAISPRLLRELAVPLVLAGVAAAGYGAIASLRAFHGPPADQVGLGRPFDLRIAVGFTAAIAAVLLVSAALTDRLGDAGIFAVTALAGFADAQAGVAAAGALVASGEVDPGTAATAVLVALSTNSVSKAVAAWSGGAAYARAVVPGLALVLGAAWAGLAAW
jgi:uncharacterized membrane protein (DUF4010 family)